MKTTKELYREEVQRRIFRSILLDLLVCDMLPHLLPDKREEFTLRWRGVDTAARALYDPCKVNKSHNEQFQSGSTSATPNKNGEDGNASG